MLKVTVEDIRDAALRIKAHVHQTPVMRSERLNQLAACQLFFKCEHLQKCGAFKARGAHNAVLQLSEQQLACGVATHSSGNHGAALALAASRVGATAYIVIPENAPTVKADAVAAYGGQISYCTPTLEAREQSVAKIVDKTGAVLIPPYDSAEIIAGQGTTVLEFLEQIGSQLDVLITPVGGGGLLAGSAIAGRAECPGLQVIGAEPSGADDAFRSFQSGIWQAQTNPDTLCDGLRASTGQLNHQVIQAMVDDIIRVDDADTVAAMRLIWTRMKQLVEPSAAVALAAVLKHPERFSGLRVGIILSGGNVDLDALPW